MSLDGSAVFGASVDAYDALRPGYPIGLVRAGLTGVRAGGTALDIGCGTGKLAGVLDALGLTVTGLEPDPRMAGRAVANGIATEVATFESWEPAGRTFDVVASAQAWHWLDPARRGAKALRLVRPSGRVLLMWNLGRHDPCVEESLVETYARALAADPDDPDDPDEPDEPDGDRAGGSPTDTEAFAAELASVGFADVTRSSATWSRRYSAAEWSRLLTTESSHLALPPGRRAALLTAVEEFITARCAGSIEIEYDCVMVTATRP